MRRGSDKTGVLGLALLLTGLACSRANAKGNQADGGARPIQVTIAKVDARDMPLSLEGLGSVTAYYTVTVHSRVDGEMQKVGFVEGQEVKKGDLLAQLDPRPFEIQLKTAEAALEKDKATLVDDKLNLDRYKDLRSRNLIAQQQVDDQQALVGQIVASIDGDQAQIDNAKLQLIYARITSPIDGVTGIRQVDPGNIVHAADTNGVVIITQLDPIAVLITLPEDDLPALSSEMEKHKLTADAFTRDDQAHLGTGEVALIDNQINQATGTLRLKAIFPNPHHTLWPNQFVKAKVLLSMLKGALVVPAVAVQHGPNGSFVYRVKPDSTVEAATVTLGPQQGEVQIIDSGLSKGDPVVVDGQYKLHVGSLVDAKEAPAKGGGASDGGASGGGGLGIAR
jgi:membrane fusion protein, multidrug efflux system